ncbi:hypothetical protein CR513_13598, partial [Mucuna pruriens]
MKHLNTLEVKLSLIKRHAKWVDELPYIIKHKQGKTNIVVDSLSRRYSLQSMLKTKLLGFKNLKELYLKDEANGGNLIREVMEPMEPMEVME